jgi:hypothetical protein
MKIFFGFLVLALTAIIPAGLDYLDIVNGPKESDGTGVFISGVGLIIVGIMAGFHLLNVKFED